MTCKNFVAKHIALCYDLDKVGIVYLFLYELNLYYYKIETEGVYESEKKIRKTYSIVVTMHGNDA